MSLLNCENNKKIDVGCVMVLIQLLSYYVNYILHNYILPIYIYILTVGVNRVTKLDLTTFFPYLSKITSNLPENYLSRSKTTSEKSYSSKK